MYNVVAGRILRSRPLQPAPACLAPDIDPRADVGPGGRYGAARPRAP